MKNKYGVVGNKAYIFLNGGMVTVIDTCDLSIASGIPGTWRATYEPHSKGYRVTFNACKNGKQKTTYLHRLLTGAPLGMVVDHDDHDQLNNRRSSNLKVVTKAENSQNRKGATAKSETGIRGVRRRGGKIHSQGTA